MRILHTSDWHLGRGLEGRSRIPEQREFCEELCFIAEREGINLVLVAGDVFDTYNPSAEAEELFYETLEKLAANGKRAVVVIAGNHDSPDRLHAANPLAHGHGIFLAGYPGEDLFGKNLTHNRDNELEVAASIDSECVPVKVVSKVDGGSGWIEVKIPGCAEHTIIAFLPYPSEQRLNEVLSCSLEDEDMQQAYSTRVALGFQQGAANFRDDTVNLAVSHLFVLGGRSSDSEREIQLGGAYVVEPAAIPEKAHYVALGHLHRPQRVGGTGVPCRYSGSPLCYSFSEADQQKEVVFIEIVQDADPIVRSIKLVSGKPLKVLRFANYSEAYSWCEQQENQGCWIDMELEIPEPLQAAQIAALRKLHQGVVNIRVILPRLDKDEQEGPRLSELSLEEKFGRFVARETGTAPERELVELLLELLEGGEESEAG